LLYSLDMSPSSLAPDLRADFEPRSSVHVRPQLALVPPPADVAPSPASYTPSESDLVALLPALRRRALRWCRDGAQADDLVQETLLRACRHTAGFENEGHLQAWAYTVLHNLLVSRGRRENSARRALAMLGASFAEGVSGWAPPPVAFLLPSVERALDELPEPFASTLRLVDLEDHSYGEAAALLGVPIGTVMSRLFRGRRRLAKALVETRDASA
jgi:RNA polymerase sigma-70 factor (ECF subfamily)